MRIALLISGFLRSFDKNYDKLEDFVKKYAPEIFVYLSKNEEFVDKYKNSEWNVKKIQELCNPVYVICENDEVIDNETKSQKIQKMWYKRYVVNKLKLCREELMGFKYDIVIVWRPDIYLTENFVNVFDFFINQINNNNIFIPNTYNEAYNIGKHKITDLNEHINDCIAIGTSKVMDTYCELYSHMYKYTDTYHNSTSILCKYLANNNISVQHFDLKYKLILSQCNVIGIAGDSGCGKSYISKLFSELFGYDSLRLECDRYHKWERNNNNWETYTHLNPYANDLDTYSSDLLSLKFGHDIFQVDYDHDTGKFTQPEHIKSKNNVVVCGLHTLFNETSNKLINLKIFLDPQEELRVFWKIKRDIVERGYNYNSVINKIEERKKDKKYIQSQRENSDLIISFKTYDDVSNINIKNMINPQLYLCVYISKHINITKLIDFLMFVKYSFKYNCIDDAKYSTLEFNNESFTKDEFFKMFSYLNINFKFDYEKHYNGYNGLIQAIIIYMYMYHDTINVATLEYEPLSQLH